MVQTKEERKAKRKVRESTPEFKAKRNEYQSKPETKVKYKKKYQDNKVEILGKSKVTRVNLKKEVFSEYSKRHSNSDVPCCNCCGQKNHIDFLALDHIAGKRQMDSEPELVKLGYSSKLKNNALIKWLIEYDYPEGFQILCHNCNQAKGMPKNNNICPHETIRKEETFARMEEQSSFEL